MSGSWVDTFALLRPQLGRFCFLRFSLLLELLANLLVSKPVHFLTRLATVDNLEHKTTKTVTSPEETGFLQFKAS